MSTFCAKIGEFSYFLWNSSKSPPFWINPTDPHPQKSVPPFGPKIPQNGKIPPFWPHWLLLCVVSVESSSAHVVGVMLRTMFSIQRNSSSKFWISKLKCLEFNIHQNNRTYQFHLLNQDLHQNVFQFHFIKLCHISQTIIAIIAQILRSSR